MQAALQAFCKIMMNNYPLFSPHIQLTVQGKILTQLQILHQVTLPYFNPRTFQDIFQINNLQKNLHQILLPPQKSTLPLEIHQYFPIYIYLSIHRNILPYFLFLNQLSTLPVDIPQDHHLVSHITTQWWRLSQFHHIHQLTLPTDLHLHSHQNKHKINSLVLSPQQKIPQFSYHQSLWFLLLLPML